MTTSHTLNRRTLLAGSAATMLGLKIGGVAGRADRVAIGDDAKAFASVLGSGTAADGELTRYAPNNGGSAIYYVHYDQKGHADSIDADFTQNANGGVPMTEGNVGESQFFPADADGQWTLKLGGPGATTYDLACKYSDDVHRDTGRTGMLLLMDRSATPHDGPGSAGPYKRGTLMMETAEQQALTPGGTSLTVQNSLSDWESSYGEVEWSQRGGQFATSPFTAPYTVNGELDGSPTVEFFFGGLNADPAFPDGATAMATISDLIPSDVTLWQTWLTRPTPDDGRTVRVQSWVRGQWLVAVSLIAYAGHELVSAVDEVYVTGRVR